MSLLLSAFLYNSTLHTLQIKYASLVIRMGEVSWADTVQLLTEKLSPDNLPYQVSRCRSVEERVSRVLNNISVNKRISGEQLTDNYSKYISSSGWLSNSGETKYLKNATISGHYQMIDKL